jgi:N utilization substance protein B
MTSDADSPGDTTARDRQGRHAARLAAVQALYQMDLTQRDLAEVLAEFIVHRFENSGASVYEGADRDFFRDLVTQTVLRQKEIDAEISAHLAEGWKLARLDSILRAILRAGTVELAARGDVPVRATINEYLNIAHAFFSGDEPGVVNGVLDKIARRYRRNEVADTRTS